MAKAKVILFESKVLKDDSHPLLLRLTVGSSRKYFSIGYSLNKNQWDKTKLIPKGASPEIKRLKLIIQDIESKANQFIYEHTKENGVINLDKFEESIFGRKQYGYVLKFFEETIENLTKAGKKGNSNAYKNTFGVYKQFRKDKDFPFAEFALAEIKRFEQFLLERDLSTNGISFHMRTLRALFNKAVDAGIASEENYPFKKYSIKREKTIHRALSLEEIIAVKNCNSENNTDLQLAKDMFMFSFYLRGISFVDMAHLKVENIRNNRLVYRRAKTGDNFNIEIPEEAMEIMKYYNTLENPTSYIFPSIKSEDSHYEDYRKTNRTVNRKLDKIAKLTGIKIPLTTYVARHTWATLAKKAGISSAIIKESLGHETEEITQVYLDSFENIVLDEANRKILELVKSETK